MQQMEGLAMKPILSVLRLWRGILMVLALSGLQLSLLAATTDISNAPLFTSSNSAVKPNIMFIMDDSGSMARTWLPDDVPTSTSKYAMTASQCNGVAYNPAVVYSLPVDAAGAALPAASLSFITPNPTTQLSRVRSISPSPYVLPSPITLDSTQITLTVANENNLRSSSYGADKLVTLYADGNATKWVDATVVSWNSSTRRLVLTINDLAGIAAGGSLASPRIGDGRTNSATYFRYTGSQPRMSYTYQGTGVITTTTFYLECNSAIGSNPGAGVFVAESVTSLSAEAQNYANWYYYYRTRMDLMKSSISLAFKGIDNRYRVGYSTISRETAVDSDDFLDIGDFDATQKTKFYTRFNAADPSVNTPLRGALAKAGQYYANKARSQTIDPVQYSCQRNFTILSTDGYWNTADESYSSPKYGPYQVDNNTAVGQQDGAGTLRPMLDGNSIAKTTTETWTTTVGTITTVVSGLVVSKSNVRTTVTYTPVAGQARINYRFISDIDIASITRPTNSSPYWVNVGTNGNHELQDGDIIQISGGNSGYNGTATVDLLSSTTFRYRSTSGSRPGNPGSVSNYTMTLLTSNGCTSGKRTPLTQAERRNEYSVVTSTLTSGTSTGATLTVVTSRSDAAPFTRVIKETDGVVSSDVTTPGTVIPTTSVVQTLTTGVTSTSGPTAASTPASTSYTAWVTSGSETAGSCVTSLPSPNPSTPTASATFTAVLKLTSTASVGPNTTTSTTSTSVQGPTTVVGAKTVVSSSSASGGSSNSLADVAAYYYATDLRHTDLGNCTGALGGGTDVCENNVPGSDGNAAQSYGDSARWQHMTTFTLGLGAGGTLKYDANYQNQLSGDFFSILNGAKNWPVPDGGPANIDDLWHAAVNGRGKYFSATDPASLAIGLNGALDAIKAITGSASAASTSSLEPVEGDNDIYVAQFTSAKWTGDVLSYKISPTTGAIAASPTWSAKAQLDLQLPASRTIYYPRAGALGAFTYANLNADGLGSHFTNFCTKTGANGAASPEQCSVLNAADKTAANLGSNLVSYLRGDQGLSYYRTRDNVLGDIISASPLYVGKPSFKYNDSGYSSFSTTNTRTGVVYAAANDGMLHAIDRATGNELWAYVPSFVIPKLYKLADTSYGNNHNYYVDGSPQMGDIKVGSVWKTILVGGLNGGGRGYYALDITDPRQPSLLWEYSDTDLGLTFGNPIITKRVDGTWVVAFSSGYNNVGPGSGNGYLYVLNANTGLQVEKIPTYTSGTTPAGDGTTPSGLGRINVWIDSVESNSAARFYGGDLRGNLWRFDIDNLVAPNRAALLLAELRVGSTPQPIVVRPVLADVNYNGTANPVVFIATGRYLGASDLGDNTLNSIYAIKDPLTATGHGDVRSSPLFVTQTISTVGGTDSGGIRTATNNPVDWSVKSGWRLDYPSTGERTNVNPQLVLNTLFVGSNIPSSNACTVGGSSYLYKLDIGTGAAVSNAANGAVGVPVGNVLVQGLTSVRLVGTGNGDGSIVTIITRSDGTLQTVIDPPPPVAGTLKRTSWRELVD